MTRYTKETGLRWNYDNLIRPSPSRPRECLADTLNLCARWRLCDKPSAAVCHTLILCARHQQADARKRLNYWRWYLQV